MKKQDLILLFGIVLVFGAFFSVYPFFPIGHPYREYYVWFFIACVTIISVITRNPVFLLPIVLGSGVYDTMLHLWKTMDVFWNIMVLGFTITLIHYWKTVTQIKKGAS